MPSRIALATLATILLLPGCGGGGGSRASGPQAGGAAMTTALSAPEALAIDEDGNLYVSESDGNRVDRIAPDGTFTVVAGTGTAGYSGDGGPAVAAELNEPAGLALEPDGGVLVVDRQNDRVRAIDGGRIRTVFGSDHARLRGPYGIAVADDGSVVVADERNARVVSLDAEGAIHRLAGGRAARSALSHPSYVALDADGSVVFSDFSANRVRRVDGSGLMTNVAGSGEGGFGGDGGTAVAAELDYPTGLAFGPDGSLYVSDTNNSCIRRIDRNGTITTVAGFGTQGFSGDGGPATDAELDSPAGLAFDTAGNLYIADQRNNRIRRVDTHGVIETVAGSG